MSDTQKIRIKDLTREHIYHPETEACIVIRGASNVDDDLEALESAIDNLHIPEYDLIKDQVAEEDYAATYHLTKDGVNTGATINIPKDFFVHDVNVKECTVQGVPPGFNVGDKYIDFEIYVDHESGESFEDDIKHVYLAVSDLFIPYSAGEGIVIDGTTIAVDSTVIPSKEELTAALEDKQDTLVSGENIVTINGNDLLQSGNIAIKTYQPFDYSWSSYTLDTIKNFCQKVDTTSSAVEGMAYLGELRCSDFEEPGNPPLSNGEAIVEIIKGTNPSGGKVIHIILTSGDTYPYRWEYTYWSSGSKTSGWIAAQPLMTAGTGISISNGQITNTLDISGKQDQTLAQAITVDGTAQTTVEGALSAINTLAASKQNALTPGDGIKIENNVISLDLNYIVIDESGESSEVN